MLHPHWLETFVALAETGSFTRAADKRSLTQAAVSQHVRQLEQALGPLLIRRPRGIELTPAGHALLGYCAEMEQAGHRLQCWLSDTEPTRGELTLITPGSIGLALYPLLLDLQAAHPGLRVRHRFGPDSEVLESVLSRSAELGLMTYRPEDARLAASAFVEEPLELVLPRGAVADCWEDLVALGFIDHPDGQAMATRLLSRHFPGNPGVGGLPQHGYVNQIGLILEPVARGLGFTVLPRYARQAFAQAEAVRATECAVPVMDTLWFVHRAEWSLTARAEHAMAYLRERMPGALAAGL
ncbi:LysR family transcriptional regulator [Xylophilus rhododendri]|uniref:LysR family transcriptional regulator n=1 Tax=Xylophilus rhododendri TaxID=2697032 RepID=A0A857J6H3_9BURK|nr:LysR family transcriptional regulator [Xylophilus rhododendri]QHI99327.1 LysR family transcriptional regulator [Xylophilus rhododendri]